MVATRVPTCTIPAKPCCKTISEGDDVIHRFGPDFKIGAGGGYSFKVKTIEFESDNGNYYIYGPTPGVGGNARAHHLRKNHHRGVDRANPRRSDD